jgi:AcrR family transcriptional regulator
MDPATEQPGRRRARRGEGTRLREELIAAATALFGEDGRAGLTLRGVARRAGVSAPSVYLHFENLEAVIAAVEERLMIRIAAATAAAAAAAPTPARALHDGCRAYLDLALADPGPYRELFTGGLRTPSGSKAGETALAVHERSVAACRPEAPQATWATAIDVWTVLHGMADLRADAPGFPWPDLDDQLSRLLVAIVGPGAAAAD